MMKLLRSFDTKMPEEVNRILTDRIYKQISVSLHKKISNDKNLFGKGNTAEIIIEKLRNI